MPVTTDFFPAPRLNRAAAGGIGPAAGIIGQVQLWPFVALQTGALEQSTLVSPTFTGPAFVDWIECVIQHELNEVGVGLELAYGPPGQVTTFNQALNTRAATDTEIPLATVGGTDVVLSTDLRSLIPAGAAGGGNPGVLRRFMPLRYPIRATSFVLKVRFRSNEVGEARVDGAIRLVTGLDLETLANLL